MLTNRKKLRNRKKKIKIFLGISLFVIFSLFILGYFIKNLLFSRAQYISPLPLASTADVSSGNEKKLQNIKEKLKKEQIEFSMVSLSNSDYIIKLKDEKEVILSTKKDISTQISSLQFMLARLKMESRQFLRLDLRYDKPIIVFK